MVKNVVLKQRGVVSSPPQDPARISEKNKTLEIHLRVEAYCDAKEKLTQKLRKTDSYKLSRKVRSLSDAFGKGLLKHFCEEIPVDVTYLVKIMTEGGKTKKKGDGGECGAEGWGSSNT